MEIKKIDKPEQGWTKDYLKQFNFHFNQRQVNQHLSLAFLLLNECLPYFYVGSINNEKINITKNFILHDFIMNLKQRSKKNYFTENILGLVLWDYQDFSNYYEIEYTLERMLYEREHEDEIREQRLKEKAKQEEEARKRREIYRQQQIEEEERKKQQAIIQGGIYGLFSINEKTQEKKVIYIGLTNRAFEKRWQEHKDIYNGIEPIPAGMNKLYDLLKEIHEQGLEIQAAPLITFKDIFANRKLTQKDKEAMELAFIQYYQPPGNTAGVNTPYIFT